MHDPDLLKQPVWRAEELGHPIPASPHAVSMALPTWDDVVGYEEKKPRVLSKLRTGYPRFVIHPLVQQLAERLAPGRPCLPFPSRRAATLAAEFVRRTACANAELVSGHGVFGVASDVTGAEALKAFWQHTGLIVSTRQAESCLAGRAPRRDGNDIRKSLRQQLAVFYRCHEGDIFLTPTGMAAQYAALQALQQLTPGAATAQLGFPYVDTLKVQRKMGQDGVLLAHLEDTEAELSRLLQRQRLAGCFCEIPGNPLLGSCDLRRISPILRQHNVPLVADDVVATPMNVDLSGYADLIATSLTKFIVGTGDAMGGAVVCNPRSPHYARLKSAVSSAHEELLWSEDAEVLERQARTFPERMRQHNANGLFIAQKLRTHPGVERTWYPKWEFSEAYEAVRRPDGGWGALITFLPREGALRSAAIYDRLEVCKGPSLGTIFTLACPFTLLAHYTELEWAESCGLSRYLIRISVGLEDPEVLWERIERALQSPA